MSYRSGTDVSKLGNPPSVSTRWLVIVRDTDDYIVELITVTAPSYFAAIEAVSRTGRSSYEKITVLRFAYGAKEALINA